MPTTALRQIFYISRARASLEEGDVRQILWTSQRNNRQRDVTGCLLYSGQHFAQVLEGGSAALDEVLERIRKDDRHHDIVVAIDHGVTMRRFPQWSMGLLYKLELAGSLEATLSGQTMSEAEALDLLAEMKPDTVMGAL